MTRGFSHIGEAIKKVVNRTNLVKLVKDRELNDLLQQYFTGLGVEVKARCVIKNNIVWVECSSLMERSFVAEHLAELEKMARERGLTLAWKTS